MTINGLNTKRDYSRKMVVLDCETPELAQESVASILGLTQGELSAYLRAFKFNPEDNSDRLLYSILRDKKITWGFSATAWFHFTRCKLAESFENGLLPLPDVIEQIWNFLFEIQSCVNKVVWDKFRSKIESEDIYRIRMDNRGFGQCGPYGVLIGDLAFNAKIGQDHYLKKAPEIVIFICREFLKQFGYALQDDYTRSTKACIVKFETDTSELSHFLSAINYVYAIEQPEPKFNIYQSDGYCGKGVPIKPIQIKKISFL